MKKTVSLLLCILLFATMLNFGGTAFAAGDAYKPLTVYSNKTWTASGGEKAELGVSAYYFTPSENYMVAASYTVSDAGDYDFSGGLLIDAASASGAALDTNAIGFMVLNKRTNTIIYPSSKADFYNIKNTKLNQQAPLSVSGAFSAKAGDEIVFIVRNNLSGKKLSLQAIIDIYSVKGDKRNKVASNYEGFSDTQGKNNWKYYYVAENEFKMPNVSADATLELTNGFVEMKLFSENWWWVNTQGKSDTASPFYGMAIGTHTQPPARGYMTARGYTVKEAGTVTFSGTVLLDINQYMNVKEGEDTIGFMVIEKRSNTVLYPADSTDFKVFKNTEQNRKTPTALSGTFEAKAGDEILFITQNLTQSGSPSVQVIMNITKDGKKIANTHEDHAGTQGKNNWRYYYASSATFKTPTLPAKAIFNEATFEKGGVHYLAPESVDDIAVKSFGAGISDENVTVTDKYGAALGYKAANGGKVSFSASAKVNTSGAEVGFAVVKKSTFQFLYPSTKAEYKKITANDGTTEISGSFTATKGDEYLFVVLPVTGKGKAEVELSLTVGGKSQSELTPYFAPAEDICSYMLGTSYGNSSYIDPESAGIKDIVFDPVRLEHFDEEKWMWYINAWADPASDAYMAIQMENANVSTPKYSMIRSYTAETDCVISVYGNLFCEIPEFLGADQNAKSLDFAICNSRGQIIYPEEQTGFHTFSAAELSAENPVLVNVSCNIAAGEKVYMIFRNRSDAPFAYVYNHFQIFETPVGESPSVPVTGAADGFSDTQGNNGWNYYYALSDSFRFTEGTVLEPVVAPGAPNVGAADKNDKKNNSLKLDLSEDGIYKIIFFVSVGVDVAAVAALVLFILIKLKKAKDSEESDKETPTETAETSQE